MEHLLSALTDVTVVALTSAAAVMIGFGAGVSRSVSECIEGVGILIAVTIVAGISSVQT
jgi:magnesium-transporting ATPase (P-type)